MFYLKIFKNENRLSPPRVFEVQHTEDLVVVRHAGDVRIGLPVAEEQDGPHSTPASTSLKNLSKQTKT